MTHFETWVFPSIREGMGMAALEAMASGIPLIVADNRGTREYITDHENGLVCQADSVREFAQAIQFMYDNSQKRELFAKNEIVNSPVPAPQDMLFGNPSVAFENEILKITIGEFLKKYGEFQVIHFNNMEGLSLDVFDLKEEYPNTKFIFSLHNYVPICMTGFYYNRYQHVNCVPECMAEDSGKIIVGCVLIRNIINK